MPTCSIAATKGAALPSMIGTSGPSISMTALSTPSPDSAASTCSAVEHNGPSVSPSTVANSVAVSRPHLWRNLCRRFDCCSDLDKRTDEPLGPPPPNEIPTSPILGILVGLANATNSRFFTNCYSDSAWITPSAGHTQPRAPENPDGAKIQQDFKMLKGNTLVARFN